MKLIKIGMLLLFMMFILLACTKGESEPFDTNSERGVESDIDPEFLYQQNCLSCHGQELSGDIGPNLQRVGAKYTKDQILHIIEHGKGGRMPGGLVTEEEARAIASWLSTFK